MCSRDVVVDQQTQCFTIQLKRKRITWKMNVIHVRTHLKRGGENGVGAHRFKDDPQTHKTTEHLVSHLVDWKASLLTKFLFPIFCPT